MNVADALQIKYYEDGAMIINQVSVTRPLLFITSGGPSK